MDSFGLGLVLNFTDNATSGMNNASSALGRLSGMADSASKDIGSFSDRMSNLSLAGMGLSLVGDQFQSVGNSVVSTLTGVIQKVNAVGTTMLTARTQLSKLYSVAGDTTGEKSMLKAGEVLDKARDYASKSIFNFEDLLPSIVMLKANSIEAFDEIGVGIDGASRNLLDYAADLAAFNPQMRNTYGTGIQAAIGAINEYIAEGNARSLKAGASLDITGILGEEKGGSIEERTQQIVRLLEKLNMVGTVSAMANTPMQRLSNAGDLLFNVMSKISDSGVFDKFTEMVATFTDYLFAIPEEELNTIAENVGGALSALMNPMIQFIQLGLKGIDVLRGLMKEHPTLARFVISLTAIAGVGLLAFGTLLKLSGSLYMLTAGLTQLKNVFSLFRGSLTLLSGGLLSVATSVLPFILMAALAYTAWTRNLFGIQNAIKETSNVFILAFKAIAASWDGEMTLEEYDWVKKAGLLDLVSAIQSLKLSFSELVSGIKEGFTDTLDVIAEHTTGLVGMGRTVKEVIDNIADFITRVTGFEFKDDWNSAGKIIGAISAALLIAIPLITLATTAFTLMSSPITLVMLGISALAAGLLYFKNNLKDSEGFVTVFGSKVENVLGNVGKVIDSLFSKDSSKNVGGKGLFENILGNILTFSPDVISEKMKNAVANIDWSKVLGAIVLGLTFAFKPAAFLGAFKTIGGGIIEGFAMLGLDLITNPAISNFGSKIFGALISSLKFGGGKLATLFAGPLLNVSLILGAIKSKIGLIFTGIGKFLGPLATKFLGPILSLGQSLLGPLLGSLGTVLGGIVSAIGGWPIVIGVAIIAAIGAIVTLLSGGKGAEGIKEKLNAVWEKLPDGIKGPLMKIGQFLGDFINDVGKKFGFEDALGSLSAFATKALDWFNMVGQKVMRIVGILIDWVKQAWDSWLGDLVTNIMGFVGRVVLIVGGIASFLIPIVMDLIAGILEVVLPIVDAIGGYINGIMEILNGLLDFIIGVFTGDWEKAWNGIKDAFGGIIDVIKSWIDGLVAVIDGALTAVKKLFNYIFNNKESAKGGVSDVKSSASSSNVGTAENTEVTASAKTGGYILSEGMMYVHPNELIVNSELTKGLSSFLKDYRDPENNVIDVPMTEQKKPNSSVNELFGGISGLFDTYKGVEPEESRNGKPTKYVVSMEGSPENNKPIEFKDIPSKVAPVPKTSVSEQHTDNSDNSVHFDSGSIVIQVMDPNSSTADLEAMAERLWKIIDRKRQVNKMYRR